MAKEGVTEQSELTTTTEKFALGVRIQPIDGVITYRIYDKTKNALINAITIPEGGKLVHAVGKTFLLEVKPDKFVKLRAVAKPLDEGRTSQYQLSYTAGGHLTVGPAQDYYTIALRAVDAKHLWPETEMDEIILCNVLSQNEVSPITAWAPVGPDKYSDVVLNYLETPSGKLPLRIKPEDLPKLAVSFELFKVTKPTP